MTERMIDSGEEPREFSLAPAFQTLWSYRRAMFLALGAVLLACLTIIFVIYALLPKETVASFGFQLTFDGAERGTFPNGTKFSSAEIVATPVLAEVYKKNDLERYLKYDDFKDAMFVLQANPDIELLSYEYQAKLADSRLTPVDRSRIEEEFRKKRESLRSAFFSLNFSRNDRLVRIPPATLNKVLQETLSTWAHQAAERKGATRYNIAVFSTNAFKKDFLTAEDYVVAVDILRATVERLLKSVEDIAKIPGAESVRVGKDQTGLADVRAHLENLIRFKVEPLVAVIRANGLSRGDAMAHLYFSDRLLDVQLAREEVRQRVAALQTALNAYQRHGVSGVPAGGAEDRSGALTPQVTESFIDRLVQLSTQATDGEYRKDITNRIIDDGIRLADLSRQADYYDNMRKAFASVRPNRNAQLEADVERRTMLLYDDVSASIDRVSGLYKMISEQNLNPDTVLYTINSPFIVRTTSPLTPATVVQYVLLGLFSALILIPIASLAYDGFRRWVVLAKTRDVSRPAGSGPVARV